MTVCIIRLIDIRLFVMVSRWAEKANRFLRRQHSWGELRVNLGTAFGDLLEINLQSITYSNRTTTKLAAIGAIRLVLHNLDAWCAKLFRVNGISSLKTPKVTSSNSTTVACEMRIRALLTSLDWTKDSRSCIKWQFMFSKKFLFVSLPYPAL